MLHKRKIKVLQGKITQQDQKLVKFLDKITKICVNSINKSNWNLTEIHVPTHTPSPYFFLLR